MVPKDIYEAARIDGVHPLRVFWRVTLPLIRPALMVAVIFRMLDALRDLRSDLCSDAEFQSNQDHVGDRPRKPD